MVKGKVVGTVRGFLRFGELSWNEQLLVSEAYFLHLTTGLVLNVIPFRWIPKVFGSRQFSVNSPQTAVHRRQSETVELIRKVIQRAGRVSPWKNRCLVSSLVGRCMLRRRKIESQISLGVAKDAAGKTVAHAWLKSGDFEIVDMSGDFTALYTF